MFSDMLRRARTPLVKEIALTILICAYLLQAIASLSPDSELKKRLTAPADLFWNFWGFNQAWNLFSPVIRDLNYHVAATITFDDGTILTWQLPRMDHLNIYQRFRMEKFRKWDADSLPWPDYKAFWPDFARYTGRLYCSPQHKPKQLSLYLFWTTIPAPVDPLVDRYALPDHDKYSCVFTYFYKPEDLQ